MSLKTEPPTHGNYHGYYLKRPFTTDPRLSLLPRSLFAGARVLDVGCNEGWVTCELAQSWGIQKAIGVDIDDTLIRGAWRRRRAVWSAQAPDEKDEAFDRPRKRHKQATEQTSGASLLLKPNYFPASCEQMFGSLPMPSSQKRRKHMFPHNVAFRTADWMKGDIPEDEEGYDVVLALSITKWIHLNHGDEGLVRFFTKVYRVLKQGGTFILEPQGWETYSKAKRLDERLKKNAKRLQNRPEDFPIMLEKIGFGSVQHLGTVGEKGFNRAVDMYVKQKGENNKEI